MKIVIIRHGEPDNPHSTLTAKGFEEARALSEFYKDVSVKDVYCSPLARARLTCEEFLKYHDNEIIIKDWLKEFTHYVEVPYAKDKVQNWDFLPRYFTSVEDIYDNEKYLDTPLMVSGGVKESYKNVIQEFDQLLSDHGYIRHEKYYKVTKANRDTIVFFCHFGMMSVLMSHLMNIPYCVITQSFVCPPTGVTVLYSEEREQGIAQFRCTRYGDISHLAHLKLTPSFHGRFCETFDSDERHN